MLNKNQDSRISWMELFEHPQVVKAFQCDRKKEMTSMDVFKKSLVFVNKSVIKLSEVDEPEGKEQHKEDETCLILEEAFNKNNKSRFERILYKFKLLYTLIEYTNTKIKNYLKKTESIHKHVRKLLNKLTVQGI